MRFAAVTNQEFWRSVPSIATRTTHQPIGKSFFSGSVQIDNISQHFADMEPRPLLPKPVGSSASAAGGLEIASSQLLPKRTKAPGRTSCDTCRRRKTAVCLDFGIASGFWVLVTIVGYGNGPYHLKLNCSGASRVQNMQLTYWHSVAPNAQSAQLARQGAPSARIRIETSWQALTWRGEFWKD